MVLMRLTCPYCEEKIEMINQSTKEETSKIFSLLVTQLMEKAHRHCIYEHDDKEFWLLWRDGPLDKWKFECFFSDKLKELLSYSETLESDNPDEEENFNR